MNTEELLARARGGICIDDPVIRVTQPEKTWDPFFVGALTPVAIAVGWYIGQWVFLKGF